MESTILSRAVELSQALIEHRRVIHRHPELGFAETRTAAHVAASLRDLGIRVETGVGKTGVVGYIGTQGPVVALRAEMDALPIQESNETAYASRVPGVMHACGHDVHTACLLGAAMLLKDLLLPGQVRLLFQPSEEGMDDQGKSGASRMIEAGVFDDAAAIFALHVDGAYPTGTLACSPGYVMASMDNFEITVLGQGAHAAQSYLGQDAVLLAAQVVCALHTIVSRRIPADSSGVISVGTIHGGTKENNLADHVELLGTIRSFDPEVRQTLVRELDRACGVARAMGGDYQLTIREGYPALANDPKLTAFASKVGCDVLGPGSVVQARREMGSEDFSFFARRAPACYLILGVGTPGQPLRPLHGPTFDVDEAALPLGAAVLAQLAISYLEEQPLA
ncbi:MAG: M20 family metallopeptidase [Chloroflexi bacterium]|nr:M20 family metallopeptidase [Chloroflexota bacterium]